MVSYSDVRSGQVWSGLDRVHGRVRVKSGVDSGSYVRVMLHDEGTAEERCADGDRTCKSASGFALPLK